MESLASQLQALLQKKLGEAIAREDLNEIYQIFELSEMSGVLLVEEQSFECAVNDYPEFETRKELVEWLDEILGLKPE